MLRILFCQVEPQTTLPTVSITLIFTLSWWMVILIPECRAVGWAGMLLEANTQCYEEAVLFTLLLCYQWCTQSESDTVTYMLIIVSSTGMKQQLIIPLVCIQVFSERDRCSRENIFNLFPHQHVADVKFRRMFSYKNQSLSVSLYCNQLNIGWKGFVSTYFHYK